eukprot:gene17073-23487_t
MSTVDIQNIIISISLFASFIIYGACYTSIGAAIPPLAVAFHHTPSELGIVFTARGIGFFIGTIFTSLYINIPQSSWKLQLAVCMSTSVAGVGGYIAISSSSYHWLIILIGLQAVSFAFLEITSNYLLPVIWGTRAQPWLQTCHFSFGLGAIVGPYLVGKIGYHITYLLVAFFSFLPLLGFVLNLLYKHNISNNQIEYELVNQSEDHQNNDNNKLLHNNDIIDSEYQPNDDADNESNNDNSNTSNNNNDTQVVIPFHFTVILFLFYFIYVGIETGYGGWIPSYSLYVNVTTSHERAAYLTAIFWGFITLGRFTSIFASLSYSTSFLMRLQLAISLIGSILLMGIANSTYNYSILVSAIYGIGMSSIYPLGLTLITDYGYKMDATATSGLSFGATLGEASLPIIIGIAIN